MKIKNIGVVGLILSSAFLLTACEPSDNDIKEAMDKQYKEINAGVESFVGKKAASIAEIKLISAKKIACKEAKDVPGYNCDVEVEIENTLVGKHKESQTLRFVKGDNGWETTK